MLNISPRKIYLKDSSFESPMSPGIFANPENDTQLSNQMGIQHRPAGNSIYEVVLHITVTAANSKEDTIFLCEVQQAGLFIITPENATLDDVDSADTPNVDADLLSKVLEVDCAEILLPFAREAAAALVTKGGFPQLLISPINFAAMREQRLTEDKAS